VVWNPWEKKSKSMADIGDEEYKQMVCVDGAAIEKPVTLKPGGVDRAVATLGCAFQFLQ
jgi:glucose-6-phosphate 1-epimerase